VTKGVIGLTLLDQLCVDGILERRGNFYYWNPTAAEKMVGISWSHLRTGQSTPRLREYLGRFVENNMRMFAKKK
jgi:hypothetical protein